MEFDHQFLPLAGEVGLLPVLTWFFMFVTFYAFVGQFIFALASRSSVAPIHHNSQTLTAIIAAVAGISYYVIQDYFRHMLAQAGNMEDPVAAGLLQQNSFSTINQLRYIDWAVTTPLLLLKTAQMLRIIDITKKICNLGWLNSNQLPLCVSWYKMPICGMSSSTNNQPIAPTSKHWLSNYLTSTSTSSRWPCSPTFPPQPAINGSRTGTS